MGRTGVVGKIECRFHMIVSDNTWHSLVGQRAVLIIYSHEISRFSSFVLGEGHVTRCPASAPDGNFDCICSFAVAMLSMATSICGMY